jgi:CheY-like chemotaxis protein
MEQRKEVSKHIPIIAVTANIRGGQIDNARDAGMDDVVGKPFRIPDLLAKMRELLKKIKK